MKQKLLELLQSTEGFLSGQELSDHLNVSRTAVWKVMKSLEEDGYEIEAVRNKGYSLKAALIQNGLAKISWSMMSPILQIQD